jgi:hypothetical protein
VVLKITLDFCRTMAGVSPSWSLLSTLARPCVRRMEATSACPSIAAMDRGEAPCWSTASTLAPADSRQHTTFDRKREGGVQERKG